MDLERVTVEKENRETQYEAIEKNVGEEILLKDSDKGVLAGKIVSSFSLHYRLLRNLDKEPLALMYHDLLDLYTIN